MVTIQVISRSTGKPIKNQRVGIVFDGIVRGHTSDEYTDTNGEVHFDVNPGSGRVYVAGSKDFEGHISGRTLIYQDLRKGHLDGWSFELLPQIIR